MIANPSKISTSMSRRLLPVWFFAFLCLLGLSTFATLPALASRRYGPPSPALSALDRFHLSALLIWYDGLLTQPLDLNGQEQLFNVSAGESVPSVAVRLEEMGLIRSAAAFRAYLVYTGLDTSLQAGEYVLSPAQSIIDIANELQDATPDQVTFVILPGWRMEEIAASLPTSGLNITADDFLTAAASASLGPGASTPLTTDFLPAGRSMEGFLYPDAYLLPRDTDVDALLSVLLRNFNLHLTPDLREGFKRHNLDVYQAVTLASLVQREAVHLEEAAQIASVFLNRLAVGMKLDSDPTVQYALGYNPIQATWWTNPLSAQDLQVNSPYNTYLHSGLPPGPICNPSLEALRAVAFPAETPYYYFRARCDGSGLHDFAVTFEEHLENGCP